MPRKSASTPISPRAISAPVFAKSIAAEAMAFSLTKRTGSKTIPVVRGAPGSKPTSRPCSSSSRDLETLAMLASGSGSLASASKRSCVPSRVWSR